MKGNNDHLFAMRHTAAHVLAAAAARLYPNAKFGVGPVVEAGFYYDILFPEPITEDDLKKLEKEMHTIIKEKHAMVREELPMDEAITFFKKAKQLFKVELLQALKKKGTTAINPEEAQDIDPERRDVASIYKTGDFVDLCRGPHLENVQDIGAFKIWKLAGAYWRGDEKNPQMQRVYGLCFETKKELDAYLAMLEEAKKRDHRKLGKELELFALLDEVGPGLPLFYPRGARLRQIVESLIAERQTVRGYETIWIPHITKGQLYRISGHLEKYDALYPPMELPGETQYYLKPMNCPHFMMLYKTQQHSYRSLPVRWVCTTTNYRYEKSGELSGLTRVRALTQDDCHVFARPDQIADEVNLMLDMLVELYCLFGFEDYWVRVSLHDPNQKEKYIGDPKIWKEAEAALTGLVEGRAWRSEIGVGEAAFYGPKLDFMFKDVIGREWQLSTIQLDMNLPERFDLVYIDAGGEKKRPVVIHRAILGSVERFLGILIEHFAGAFPMWLAPEQIRLATVGEDYVAFARELKEQLLRAGLRVELDASDEKVGKKVRASAALKVPWTIVVGEKEVRGGDLRVNVFGAEEDLIVRQADLVERAKQASALPL